MTKSFAHSLIVASILIAGAAPASHAKEYTIRGKNNASYGAACTTSPTCVNWGGGVYTNGDTKVICTKSKCTMYEDDAPTRTGSNDNRSNDPSGSTVTGGGGKTDVAGGAGGNPDSMGGDSEPSIN